ncbi:unnamed protein product [Mesocestoides corti]|uniref:Ovule protein n=1 Tax=Mesocestoides corti TaxID=53468 RepID=A0A0R3UMI3_MESCO|nr:unnamed protein product [Mesocestoides corti]
MPWLLLPANVYSWLNHHPVNFPLTDSPFLAFALLPGDSLSHDFAFQPHLRPMFSPTSSVSLEGFYPRTYPRMSNTDRLSITKHSSLNSTTNPQPSLDASTLLVSQEFPCYYWPELKSFTTTFPMVG